MALAAIAAINTVLNFTLKTLVITVATMSPFPATTGARCDPRWCARRGQRRAHSLGPPLSSSSISAVSPPRPRTNRSGRARHGGPSSYPERDRLGRTLYIRCARRGWFVSDVACTRFRRHRVRCFDGAGGGVVHVQAAKKAPSLEAPTAWEGQHVALARAAANAKPFLRTE